MEPSSPRYASGKSKEPAQLDRKDIDFQMADLAQDSSLWDKIGGQADGVNLGDPVKTIEVSAMRPVR